MTFEDELLGEFLIESYESLDQLDSDFVALETELSPDALAGIFRAVHTIKGSSGFLGLGRLEGLAHVGESLLARVRSGDLAMTSAMVSALLAMIDVIRAMLGNIEAAGGEGDVDEAPVQARLAALLAGEPEPVDGAPTAEPDAGPEAAGAGLFERVGGVNGISLAVARLIDSLAGSPEVGSHFARAGAHHRIHLVTWLTTALGGPDVYRGKTMEAAHAGLAIAPAHLDLFRSHLRAAFSTSGGTDADLDAIEAVVRDVGVPTTGDGVAPTAPVVAQPPALPEPVAAPLPVAVAVEPVAPVPVPASDDHRPSSVSDTTIRVDVALLDTLMNLVGELVLARNQVLQYVETFDDRGFTGTIQRLDLITSELQGAVMQTRMQPIGAVWGKVPRVVRDLAVALGKQIRVDMEGADTELDKSIVEAIKDPMTHLVRNAADHGIESPEARVAAGKPAEGALVLRAFHEGGQVVIEISDDGAGIDVERLRAKAVETGVLRAEQAGRMSDRDSLDLVFSPGLSTAKELTNISGRGVGMDVVRTNIERIGGQVDVTSTVGTGTTFRIKIPLTLAIIPALMVTVAGDRYAIPQASLLELVRIERDHVGVGIEHVHGTPLYRLRGKLLPLVHLDRHLGVAPAERPAGAISIVVLQADGRPFGLVVDEINDTEEIVVKPLGKLLKGVDAFAGATILGDGRVALILDVLRTAQAVDLVGEGHDKVVGAREEEAVVEPSETLLVLGSGDQRVAVPLAAVTRLEEFTASDVERGGGREVVQYRGEIMPLARIGGVVGGHRDGSTTMPVVVVSRAGRSVGIVVDQIVDIVETVLDLHHGPSPVGALVGTAVVAGRVTDVVDVESIVRSVDPAFYDRPERVLAVVTA